LEQTFKSSQYSSILGQKYLESYQTENFGVSPTPTTEQNFQTLISLLFRGNNQWAVNILTISGEYQTARQSVPIYLHH